MQTHGPEHQASQEARLAAEALRQLQAGNAQGAYELLDELIAQEYATATTLRFAGFLLTKIGRLNEAKTCFRRSSELEISEQALLGLAACHHQMGDTDAEIQSLSRCAQHFPKSAFAREMLAAALERVGENRRALTHLVLLARMDPQNSDYLRKGISLAARTSAPTTSRGAHSALLKHPIDVVVCSISPERMIKFRKSLDASWGNSNYRVIQISDARSLAEGFARGISLAQTEIIVLCHDDIAFIDSAVMQESWPARLVRHFDDWDVIGVAGSTRATTPSVMGSGHGFAHGWISHAQPGADEANTAYVAGVFSSQTSPVRAQALDGVFIAARKKVFDRVQFDASTFDAFHGYDFDFSYRCHLAGLRIAVCPDLWIAHYSHGNFGDAWQKFATRTAAKFPELSLNLRMPNYYAHTVSDLMHAGSTYDMLWRAATLAASDLDQH
jgi:Tfp pilus assembly protein PilF